MNYWDSVGRWINTLLVFIVGVLAFDALFRLLEANEDNVIVSIVRVLSVMFLVPFQGMFGEQDFVLTTLIGVLGYALLAGIALGVLRSLQASRAQQPPPVQAQAASPSAPAAAPQAPPAPKPQVTPAPRAEQPPERRQGRNRSSLRTRDRLADGAANGDARGARESARAASDGPQADGQRRTRDRAASKGGPGAPERPS